MSKNFLTDRIAEMESVELRTVTVSEKGQFAIPVDIRRKLNISKGDKLLITVSGKKVLIEKSEAVSKRMRNDFRHLLVLSEKTAQKLWEKDNDAVWNKV